MTIANQIIIQAKEGTEKVLKETLNTLVEEALLEKGCQKFELYQLYDEQRRFFIVEIWKSERRYDEHLKSAQYQSRLQEISRLSLSQTTHPLKLTQCLTKLGLKNKEKN